MAEQKIVKSKNKKYITFYNPEWKGVTSSTKELFKNLVPIQEIYRKRDAKEIAKLIVNNEIEQVVFSSFALGWDKIIKYIKKYNSKIKIKTFFY